MGAQADRARRRHQPLPLRRRDHVGSAATIGDDQPAQRVGAGGGGAGDVLVAERTGVDAGGRVGDQRQAEHARPAWRAVITSWTVDIPTSPAPSVRSRRTSAGVS